MKSTSPPLLLGPNGSVIVTDTKEVLNILTDISATNMELDYCLQCLEKHTQTAKVLMREAIQRAEVEGISSEGVQEKMRGVIEELVGAEDDSDTLINEGVRALNNKIRALRKKIWESKATIGGGTIRDLMDTKRELDSLVEGTYETARLESGPTYEKLIKEYSETGGAPLWVYLAFFTPVILPLFFAVCEQFDAEGD